MRDGTARCWGGNNNGELGDNSNTDAVTPATVADTSGMALSGVAELALGNQHSCALLTNGTVRCWGGNASGTGEQLTGVTAIASGAFHVCALLVDGTVWCWGSNYYGELGSGVANPGSASWYPPVQVAGLTDVAAISANDSHSCALGTDGTVSCWGFNYYGELGSDATTDGQPYSALPVAVEGLPHAVAIGTGDSHSCAILDDGTARCWGEGTWGQLGDGTYTYSTPNFVNVSGLSGARHYQWRL
jgi:alpha-tubulin suppressor-like RCC1 family protein